MDVYNADGKSRERKLSQSQQFFVDVLHMSRNKYTIGRQGKYGREQTNYVYCTAIMFNSGNLACCLNKLKQIKI